MPPANSRATSPPETALRAGSPSYMLPALRELAPVNQDVLHLADTLTTQADEEAAQPSDPSDPVSDAGGHNERPRRQRSDVEQRDRLRRVMNRLSRIHGQPSASYSDRVPRQNSLYDWSPANEADGEDELDQILAEMRSSRPSSHPDMLRLLGPSHLDADREPRMPPHSHSHYSSRLLASNQPSAADTSLRSAAILQSARRNPRFAARSRDHLHRHTSDRAASRSPHRADSREPHAISDTRQTAMQQLLDRRASLARERERERERERDRQQQRDRDQERDRFTSGSNNISAGDSLRRGYPEPASTTTPIVTPLIEQTIKYLSRIRDPDIIEDTQSAATEARILLRDHPEAKQLDFVLDTTVLSPPPPTSWLTPGAVLSGCQYATTVTSTITSVAPGVSNTLYRFPNGDSMSSTLFDPTRPWLSHDYSSLHRRLASAGPDTFFSHSPSQDRWPVKVTIHAVDYNKMTLCATMEAYNVPSHPHSHQSMLNNSLDTAAPCTRTSSITTFLEGEILDFNQYTLLTESFKSNAATDATYWWKLPCFQNYSGDELVRNLTSRSFYENVLNKDWVLMRWKERCFVKPLSSNSNANDASANASSARDLHSSATMDTAAAHITGLESSLGGGDWMQDQHITTFDDSNCGLTISGFYYVCLNRRDGKLEGLYYDPQSSPYQCLKLESVNSGVFPAWEFR